MQWSLFLLILMGQCSFFPCHLYEYHFVKEEKTWAEAQKYCRDNHTDLATVWDMTDMDRLRQCSGYDKDDAWIGLYKPDKEDFKWQWSLPGLEYKEDPDKWHSGEPNSSSAKHCVMMEDDKWRAITCVSKHNFICYNEANSSNKFHLIEEEKCWPEAQSYCRKHHTDLVSGLDQLKDKELTMKISQSEKEPWIFGLFRDTGRWSDGSNSSFRHWDHCFNKQTGKKCAMLDKKGRWKTDKCDHKKSFFCYDDKVILIKERKTWTDALDYCRENYNDLVSITNPHQQRWVQQRAKNASTDSVWLGLRYTCTLDLWFWVNDELVCYENWAKSDKVTDMCDFGGAMDREGYKWIKKSDTELFNFICAL